MPVQVNNSYFEQLGRSAGVIAIVDSCTEKVAATARATAPSDTGDYRDGISTAGKYQRRYVGLVIASDPKSMLVESRTGNLARAVRANTRGRTRG